MVAEEWGECWFAKMNIKLLDWPGEQKNDHFSLTGWYYVLFLVPTGCFPLIYTTLKWPPCFERGTSIQINSYNYIENAKQMPSINSDRTEV